MVLIRIKNFVPQWTLSRKDWGKFFEKNEGTVDAPIRRRPDERMIREVHPEGKRAVTHYFVEKQFADYALVRLRLDTGRTHQIRVHMKYLNCPILGDDIYFKKDSQFPNATLMLHAHMLKIVLPGQKEPSTFITKTPERFIQVEKRLKKKYKKTILNEQES